ncbi:MAG: GNAT family N-acetyltransferase [Arenicella sp.]|nr:GNAT family N-acetyltransferase [Arenicella sp.]
MANVDRKFVAALSHHLILSGKHASLEPMLLSHVGDLNEAAADGELWRSRVTTVPNKQGMLSYVEHALRQRDSNVELPFVVRRLSDNRVVGTTRYYQIRPEHHNFSIGYTWYSESVQRTAINTECKLMLLQHSFEEAACISVQWHTHHNNKRSQAAILRLGASFEGILRNHIILADGRIRHTHCFSMLDDEWPASKAYLTERLDKSC